MRGHQIISHREMMAWADMRPPVDPQWRAFQQGAEQLLCVIKQGASVDHIKPQMCELLARLSNAVQQE